MLLRKPICSAAALVTMAFLSGSASASPISAGTRASIPPGTVLFQKVRCQRICHYQGRTPVCRVVCNHQRHQRRPIPVPGTIPRPLPMGPVGAPRG
jgi:hypothetical protein